MNTPQDVVALSDVAMEWDERQAASLMTHLAGTARQGTCLKRQVGAALVSLTGEILDSAANGAPEGMTRCDRGGCVRCSAVNFSHGLGYDLCVCLHAEQNLLISAMSNGIELSRSILATSYQPCFMCAKLIVAAGLAGVRYVEPWVVPEPDSGLAGLNENYQAFWSRLPLGCSPFR